MSDLLAYMWILISSFAFSLLWYAIWLEDKLRHTKHFKSLFEQKSIPARQHQNSSAYGQYTSRSWGTTFVEKTQKQSKEIIWLARGYIVALFEKAWLAVLSFWLLKFEALLRTTSVKWLPCLINLTVGIYEEICPHPDMELEKEDYFNSLFRYLWTFFDPTPKRDKWWFLKA